MSHDHSHTPPDGGGGRTKLAIAFGLTAIVLVAQFTGSIITGSLALLVDTGHMLTDVFGLLLALVAASLALRPTSPKRTWGFARAEVISAGVQAGILLAVGLYAAVEGIRRLFEPSEIEGTLVLVFGVIGLVANVISIAVLASGRNDSLNLKAAFLEVLNDALGSVAVIASGIIIMTTGFLRADAIAALIVAALIVPRAISLMREAGSVLLESTPPGLDLNEVKAHLLTIDHVVNVHDLHASRISSRLPVLTAHIVLEDECFTDGHAAEMLSTVQGCVAHHFPVSIEHSTIQFERENHEDPAHHA